MLLSVQDLRSELHKFAKESLRHELSEFEASIVVTMRREMAELLAPHTPLSSGHTSPPQTGAVNAQAVRRMSTINTLTIPDVDARGAEVLRNTHIVEPPLVDPTPGDFEWSRRHVRCAAVEQEDDGRDWKPKAPKMLKTKSRMTTPTKPPSPVPPPKDEAEPPPLLKEAWVTDMKAQQEGLAENTKLQDNETPASPRTSRRTSTGSRRDLSFERLRLGDTSQRKSTSIVPAYGASPSFRRSTCKDNVSIRFTLETYIYHWSFEYWCFFCIIMNAVTIGVESDYKAKRLVEEPPPAYVWIEYAFCTFFTIEVLLRLYVNRQRYLQGPGWQMNIFDCVVVGLQFVDMIVTLAIRMASDGISFNFYILRMLRLIRLVRVVRTLKVLRMIGEVRTIIWSVASSLKLLCGACLILLLMTYMTGIYFSDLVLSHRADTGPQDENFDTLGVYFGSLSRSILTLYQAISGGIDWDAVVVPLMAISPWLGLVFSLYVAFSVLALMNTITGVFVENALAIGKRDKDSYTVNYLRSLFQAMDEDEDGAITWDDFQSGIERKDMTELFKAIELDQSEAQCVFRLLDIDNSGSIDADEFLNGCLRLRGHAKALDMLIMMRETKTLIGSVAFTMDILRRGLQNLGACGAPEIGRSPSEGPEA